LKKKRNQLKNDLMGSISKRTGKHFTGKFAETALKIGLATEGENLEGNEQEETPALPPKVAKAPKGKIKKQAPKKVVKKVKKAKK
jgi:hypothetical protein